MQSREDILQRAQSRKLEFENKALILQTDHGLQKDAVAKIAQQFASKQVTKQYYKLIVCRSHGNTHLSIAKHDATLACIHFPAEQDVYLHRVLIIMHLEARDAKSRRADVTFSRL